MDIHPLLLNLKQLVAEEALDTRLRETYRQFEVMNETGEWAHPLVATHGELLLPQARTPELFHRFIDEIHQGIVENSYLVRFLDALPAQIPAPQVMNVLPLARNTAREYLLALLAFAFCLDRLNLACRRDLALQEHVVDLYQRKRRGSNFYRFGNLMPIIKLHSIELPLVRFLKAKKKGVLPPSFGKFILSLNIFEAALVDLLTGKRDNARATLPLIVFSPNFSGRKNFIPGAPSTFSPDGLALWMSPPEPRLWADLYQVWNMAFVSQFHLAPFLLAKLLIPSVSRYADRPAEYMHTRITALHLAMHFLDFAISDPKLSVDLKGLGAWAPELTTRWGEFNAGAARHYLQAIKKPTAPALP